jgi:hypothetical protein
VVVAPYPWALTSMLRLDSFPQTLYKDMVSVVKNASTKALEVTSLVYQIEEAGGVWGSLFPERASREHSFCYLIVEPGKRTATVWYLAHIPMF